MDVRILMPLMTRKSGAHERFLERVDLRHADRPIVQKSPLASFRREQLVARRIKAQPYNHLLPMLQRDRYTEHGESVGEVRRPIERVDIPAILASGFAQAFFLA